MTRSLAAILIVSATAAPHKDRLEQIRVIQNTPNVQWKAALVDRFADQAPGASKPLLGVKPGWKESIQAGLHSGKIERFSAKEHGLEGVEIPESFDSAKNW